MRCSMARKILPTGREVSYLPVNGGREAVNGTKMVARFLGCSVSGLLGFWVARLLAPVTQQPSNLVKEYVMIFCAAVLAAATVVADEKLDQVASDFRTIGRIAALADNLRDNRQVMLAIVDNDLEMLREKRPDETYRWASLQREEASRVKDQKSIERVQSEKELREVTLTAPNAYRLEVSVPTKQSLVSKNNSVYIRNVIVESNGFDGKN